jgi:uncharacterized protein
VTGVLPVRPGEGGVEFTVYTAPRSAKPGVRGIQADALKVAVHAAPEKGKANDEVVEVLSAFLGVKRGAVAIVAGAGMRRKRVRVTGMSAAALLKAVEGI